MAGSGEADLLLSVEMMIQGLQSAEIPATTPRDGEQEKTAAAFLASRAMAAGLGGAVSDTNLDDLLKKLVEKIANGGEGALREFLSSTEGGGEGEGDGGPPEGGEVAEGEAESIYDSLPHHNAFKEPEKTAFQLNAKMNDGALDPVSLLDRYKFVPEGYEPLTPGPREALMALPGLGVCEQQCTDQILEAFDAEKEARGWLSDDLLDEGECLMVYAYSFELRKLGTGRDSVQVEGQEERVKTFRSKIKNYPIKESMAKDEDLMEIGEENAREMLGGILTKAITTEEAVKKALEDPKAQAAAARLNERQSVVFCDFFNWVDSHRADDSQWWQLYGRMNAAMRAYKDDEAPIVPWRDVIYYLLGALNKLPPSSTLPSATPLALPMPNPPQGVPVFRGIGLGLDPDRYRQSSIFVWAGFSSTSSERSVASSFVGGAANGALFLISATSARSIEKYSRIPAEKELLLMPNTAMRVTAVAGQGFKEMLNIPEGVQVLEAIEIPQEEAEIQEIVYDAETDVTTGGKRLLEMVEKYPDHPASLFARGMMHCKLHDNADYEGGHAVGIPLLRKACDFDPKHLSYLQALGDCMISNDDAENGIFVARMAQTIDPYSSHNTCILFQGMSKIGDHKGIKELGQELCAKSIHSVAQQSKRRGLMQLSGAMTLGTLVTDPWLVEAEEFAQYLCGMAHPTGLIGENGAALLEHLFTETGQPLVDVVINMTKDFKLDGSVFWKDDPEIMAKAITRFEEVRTAITKARESG